MKTAMKRLRWSVGNTMVELTVALAISAIISVPLTGIIADELRIPLRVSNDVTAVRRLQTSTSILSEDATSARSFTAGVEPDYGTFSWLEFAGAGPAQVTARYYWKEDSLFRELTRNADAGQPLLIIEGIAEYSDIVFNHVPPNGLTTRRARSGATPMAASP